MSANNSEKWIKLMELLYQRSKNLVYEDKFVTIIDISEKIYGGKRVAVFGAILHKFVKQGFVIKDEFRGYRMLPFGEETHRLTLQQMEDKALRMEKKRSREINNSGNQQLPVDNND